MINKKIGSGIKYSKIYEVILLMNILLIFFALPIATIIISIALQKILKCPILVAAIIFAIFLICVGIFELIVAIKQSCKKKTDFTDKIGS